MPKTKPHNTDDDIHVNDIIGPMEIDMALGMFRDMLLKEYTGQIIAGKDPNSARKMLASPGSLSVLFKGAAGNTDMLIDKMSRELKYVTNDYYDLYVSYARLSGVLNVLYEYSDAGTSYGYRGKAKAYLEKVSKLAPDDDYDEQKSLRDIAMAVLKWIADGVPITMPRENDRNITIDAPQVLSNIAMEELGRLESDIKVLTGYIGTYSEILKGTIRTLKLNSGRRASKTDGPNG